MLIESETEPARKPLALAFTAARQTRRSFLAKLREEVTILHTIGLDYAAIGRALGISAEDTRALCQSLRERALRRHLTRRALNTLLQGRPAYIGGKTISRRANHLVEIASAYTPDKLLCEPRVGQVTVTEIQLWLEKRDASLRSPY